MNKREKKFGRLEIGFALVIFSMVAFLVAGFIA